MGLKQKVFRINIVVPHQADQCRAVAFPEIDTDSIGSRTFKAKVGLHVIGHRPIDVREYVRPGVVQCVIQIEDPGLSELAHLFNSSDRLRIRPCVVAIVAALWVERLLAEIRAKFQSDQHS